MRGPSTHVSRLWFGLAALATATLTACGADPFPSESVVTGLRVLAVQKTPAYGTPDGTVDLRMLVWDGKANPASPRPIQFAWLGRPPLDCRNPLGDRYYYCFQQFAAAFADGGLTSAFAFGSSDSGENEAGVRGGGSDAATGESGGSDEAGADVSGRAGEADAGEADAGAADAGEADAGEADAGAADAGPPAPGQTAPEPPGFGQLTPEPMTGFVLPPDPILPYSIPIPSKSEIITRTREATGVTPYGVSYVFFALCAGHLSLEANAGAGSGISGLPIACRGDQNELVGPDDFVSGYASVYASDELTNANPIIKGFLFDNLPLSAMVPSDPASVPHVPRCTKGKSDDCPTRDLRPIIDPASAEIDPDGSQAGTTLREQMWVSYYTTKGTFQSSSKLVNDATKGWNEKYGTSWHIPIESGPVRIWAVVHDNRGGVAWAEADVIVDP